MAAADQFPPRAREYLDALRNWGRGASAKKAREQIGIHESSVSRWRTQKKGFREAERKAIKEANKSDYTTDVVAMVPEEDLSLDGIEETWIKAYEATYDRIAACKEVGVKWSKIRKMMNSRPAFMRRFREVFGEVVVRIEDTLAQKGMEGDGPSARTFLKAHRPETYGNKVTVNTNHTHFLDATSVEATKKAWLSQFGDVPQNNGTKVIEAEVIE